jgi:hypothetical protein
MEAKVVGFEPGDGTHYTVVIGYLDPSEAKSLNHGGEAAMFFGFTRGKSPVPCGTFGINQQYLSYDYYCQEMSRHDWGDGYTYDLIAGHLLIGWILGRDIGGGEENIESIRSRIKSIWNENLILELFGTYRAANLETED